MIPCPRCPAELADAGDGRPWRCESCGSVFVARRIRVRRLAPHKIAGVRRHRFRLDAHGEPEPIFFEGPQGLAAADGDSLTLLSQEGRPALALVQGQAHVLAAAPSADGLPGGERRLGSIAGGLAWLLAFVLFLAVVTLLDQGSWPR